MSILDIFKKKQRITGAASLGTSKGGINLPPTTPRPEPPTPDGTSIVAEKPTKTGQELFEEWYSKLSPEMRKKVDKKMEKISLKMGVPVCCKKCGKAGSNKETGPFRKVDKGVYVHQNCQIGGIRG